MAKFTVHQPNGQAVHVEAGSQAEALDQVLNAGGPDVTSLGSFGRGAVGMLPLGDQAYAGIAGLAEHKPYAQERKELGDEIAADKETNPGSRLAGQVTGAVAPILATGGLAAPETLLGAAGQGALVGGAYGAGNAIDTLAGGGSGAQAAGDVAVGAGLGAAGGGAAKVLGKYLASLGKGGASLESDAALSGIPHPAAPPVPPTAPASAAEGSIINGRGVNVPTGAPSGVSMSAGVEAGGPEAHIPAGGPNPVISSGKVDALPGNGYAETTNSPAASDSELRARQAIQLWGATPMQVRKLPGKDLTQTVNRLVDVAKQSSTPENDLFALTDRYGDRAKKFISLHEHTGKAIGDLIENAKVQPIPADTVASDILTKSIKLPTAEQAADLKQLAEQVKGYADESGNLDFKRLHQLKGDIGELAFKGQGNDVKQGAYHTISNLQEAEMHKAGVTDIPQFKTLKQTYEMTSRVMPMLRHAAAKSLTGRPSLTELMSGHPMAALGKLGGERVEGLKNAIGFKVADALSGGKVPSASNAVGATAANVAAPTDLHLQHPAMAPWRQMFQKNAAGAENPAEMDRANAVTDFTLSQRDPAYAAAKQKAADSPVGEQAQKQGDEQ